MTISDVIDMPERDRHAKAAIEALAALLDEMEALGDPTYFTVGPDGWKISRYMPNQPDGVELHRKIAAAYECAERALADADDWL